MRPCVEVHYRETNVQRDEHCESGLEDALRAKFVDCFGKEERLEAAVYYPQGPEDRAYGGRSEAQSPEFYRHREEEGHQRKERDLCQREHAVVGDGDDDRPGEDGADRRRCVVLLWRLRFSGRRLVCNSAAFRFDGLQGYSTVRKFSVVNL